MAIRLYRGHLPQYVIEVTLVGEEVHKSLCVGSRSSPGRNAIWITPERASCLLSARSPARELWRSIIVTRITRNGVSLYIVWSTSAVSRAFGEANPRPRGRANGSTISNGTAPSF